MKYWFLEKVNCLTGKLLKQKNHFCAFFLLHFQRKLHLKTHFCLLTFSLFFSKIAFSNTILLSVANMIFGKKCNLFFLQKFSPLKSFSCKQSIFCKIFYFLQQPGHSHNLFCVYNKIPCSVEIPTSYLANIIFCPTFFSSSGLAFLFWKKLWLINNLKSSHKWR